MACILLWSSAPVRVTSGACRSMVFGVHGTALRWNGSPYTWPTELHLQLIVWSFSCFLRCSSGLCPGACSFCSAYQTEKLKDPNVLETFQAMIGGKFAPFIIMSNEDKDIYSMITTFNTAVTETASEILGKHREKKTNLGHCRNSWSERKKKRTAKEKIWAWRIWEIQGSEQQHQ